jgi:hypothetical protein
MKDLILARVDRARLALLEARDAISAKKVADLAKAAEVFATRQKSEEARGYAHEIYVEALRLEGAYLEEVEKNKGGRPAKTSSPRVLVSVPTLKEQEIPRRQSVLAQSVSKAAREAPEVFEAVRSGAKLATIRRHFAKADRKSVV